MLELGFAVIKSNQNIDKLRIFENHSLYTACVNGTTFFVKNQASVIEVLKIFDKFSRFSDTISGLKSNE